ncbi:hypothetical protein GF325_10320 [Candidatus Bathyarchaeota archaeon]|nr:hypothetical protein [Candidatus Bathyarchaeota archaeon]
MERWKIVRLDYLFSVIIPCLIAIYISGNDLLVHLKTMAGWAFLGIAGNVINDAIDKDRDLGWHVKELIAISLGSILLAMLCFVDLFVENPVNIMWICLAIALVLLYCVKFKKHAITSTIVQVTPEIMFPFFTIYMPVNFVDWCWLISLLLFGYLSQLTHEAIDGEAITKFSKRQVQAIIILFSILTLASGVILFALTLDWNIVPFALVPLATIYIFRAPRDHTARNIKDVGIILGNFFMIYFTILLLA